MRFAVMIEGQEDVGWEDWVAIARDCERLGFETLFRSDHYLSVDGITQRGSLDAWSTVCALAATTTTLKLGTLVSPATFRHPSLLAKTVVTADHISGGRIELGIGAGWHEDEHAAYGFAFPPVRTRMDQLAEQLAIIAGSWAPGPFTFEGEHWTVRDLEALPKPVQQPHPPLLMGGAAGPRSAALAARYAAEYNVVYADPDTARERRAKLEAACREHGRDPATLGFSLMTGFVIGADDAAVRERAERINRQRGADDSLEELAGAWLVGTPEQIVARLCQYADAGLQRVMLQHQLFRDSEALELFAERVVPALGH